MSWVKAQFSSLFLEPTRNGIYKAADSHGSGCKIINMGEIFGYSFIGGQDMSRITVDEAELQRFHVKAGDLLFARRSLVESGAGKCSIVNVINESIVFESSIIRVRLNQAIADPLFYMYWMRSLAGRTAIGAIVTGLNVKGIRSSDLSNIEVEVPPLETQKAISSILRSYDELIENYQKQIKLLEEAAQRLYKEWFVDLRFPGHENVMIVNGVPEGWENTVLGTIASFKRGKTITKKDISVGNIPVVAGGLEPAYYCNKSNTADRVVTVSGSGANAGFTRLYNEPVWASDCSYVDTNSTRFLCFVFCFLIANKCELDNLQKGAAQPHVYAKDINALRLLLPKKTILMKYEEIISVYFDSIARMQSQIKLLTEARDRLLPKLMSGEIEV